MSPISHRWFGLLSTAKKRRRQLFYWRYPSPQHSIKTILLLSTADKMGVPSTISLSEHARLVCPVVPANVNHNAKILSNLRSLYSILFGLIAGLLGLESFKGFVPFVLSALVVEYVLFPVWVRSTTPKQAEGSLSARLYFDDPKLESFVDLNLGDGSGTTWRMDAFSHWTSSVLSFILTWTLAYGTMSR